MAGIPYVQDPLQMLWQFQQDQARTNLLENQAKQTAANTRAIEQGTQYEAENQKALAEYRQQATLQNLLAPVMAGNASPMRAAQDQQQAPIDSSPQIGSTLSGFLGLPGAPYQARPTPSIARDEAVEMDPNARMMADLRAQADEARNNIILSRQMSQKYAGIKGVEVPKEQPWVTRLNDINNKMAEISIKQTEQQAKNVEQTANIMRDVDSQQGLINALGYVRRTFGPQEEAKIRAGLPRDMNGDPVWTDASKQAIAPYVSRYTTMAQRVTQQNQAAQLDRQLNADAERADYHDQSIEQRRLDRQAADRRAANAQAGANQRAADRNAIVAEGLDLRGQREQRMVENQTDSALQSDPVIKTYDKFDKAYNAARNVFSAINNGSSRQVQSAAADDMMKEYKNAIENFRANSGGKWSVEDQKKYSSVLQKMESFVATIGQGYKPPTEVMETIAGEINRIYNEQNASAVKRTLQARAKVYNQGGDPMNVRSPASIDRAVQFGIAQRLKDPDTGIEYLKFGKDAPNAENTFPIYTKPKAKPPKRGVALLNSMIGEEEPATEE